MKTAKHYNKYNYRRRGFLWLVLAIIILLIACLGYIYLQGTSKISEEQQLPTENTSLRGTKQSPAKTRPVPIPTSFEISVPYAPQAPLSNWAVHEESCEEAAIYMYKAFLDGTIYPSNRITDAEADKVFREMKSWQVSKYGKEPDLTMTALGTFASSYYGYTPTVKKDITEDNIKRAIADGHPVIVPVMTHSLENKMYGPVSVYHVLLIKGYDSTGVITNDAGVGNGVNKHYSWDVLWRAIDAQTAKMGAGREMLYLTK